MVGQGLFLIMTNTIHTDEPRENGICRRTMKLTYDVFACSASGVICTPSLSTL